MALNKLVDLNDHLFAQIERLDDEELTSEELEKEISRSKAITSVGQTIINNASLLLNAQKHFDEYGDRKNAPTLLRLDNSEK